MSQEKINPATGYVHDDSRIELYQCSTCGSWGRGICNHGEPSEIPSGQGTWPQGVDVVHSDIPLEVKYPLEEKAE